MKEVLVATGNRGKLRELELLLNPFVEKVYSLADFPDVAPAVEDGRTFAENAVKKSDCGCPRYRQAVYCR